MIDRNGIDFKENVPYRNREQLTESYRHYLSQKHIYLMGEDLNIILKDWGSRGNDPYSSNRYGFYDSSTQRYLDFFTGERKASHVFEIMAGLAAPAECGYNRYGEPMPVKNPETDWKGPQTEIEDIGKEILEKIDAVFYSPSRKKRHK